MNKVKNIVNAKRLRNDICLKYYLMIYVMIVIVINLVYMEKIDFFEITLII